MAAERKRGGGGCGGAAAATAAATVPASCILAAEPEPEPGPESAGCVLQVEMECADSQALMLPVAGACGGGGNNGLFGVEAGDLTAGMEVGTPGGPALAPPIVGSGGVGMDRRLNGSVEAPAAGPNGWVRLAEPEQPGRGPAACCMDRCAHMHACLGCRAAGPCA